MSHPDCTPATSDASREKLLDELDKERAKFTRANTDLMHQVVDLLIYAGVYPKETVPGNPNDVWTMVEGYGARWHIWRAPLACRHCKADLRDHVMGPPFKREIGIEIGGDHIDHFECPDCERVL
jgi:hypothetical protein